MKLEENSSLDNKNKQPRTRWFKIGNYLSLCLVFLGLVVRTIQYLSNRSLWGDEVDLALNIINRSYSELTQTLDNNQAAPLGFLWLEKLITQLWNDGEYALRLVPFLASIASLVLFYRLVRKYSSALAAPIAIALFACGRYLLYFSTELKPYSSDVAISLLIFWVLVKAHRQILSSKQILGLACLGSLAIWFSYPSIFMLAGLEGWNLLTIKKRYLRQTLVNRLPIYLSWLVSFGLFYWLTIVNTLSNQDLSASWAPRYPSSWVDIVWLLDALGKFFYHPLGFRGITDGIGIFAFVVGCVVCYQTRRTIWLALISPFVATIIAAYLHKYPFRDRLVLFLAPLAIMIIAEGIAFLLEKISNLKQISSRKRPWLIALSGLLGIVCLYSLVFTNLYRASNFIFQPEQKHEIRPVIAYVAEQVQLGGKIYVYEQGNRAFDYYLELNGYQNLDYTKGTVDFDDKKTTLADKQRRLAIDLQPLQGYPVWFIVRADSKERQEIRDYLDQVGNRKDLFSQAGAEAYFYELNN